MYNRGYSLKQICRNLSSPNDHAGSPARISHWLAAHPALTAYRWLRAHGLNRQ